MKKEKVWTKVPLKPLLKKWKKKLRLSDWKIDLDYVSHDKMSLSTNQGQINVYADWHEARIKIMDPELQIDEYIHSVEFVLIHELLHIHFDALLNEKSRPETISVEQKINIITENLTDSDVRKASI